MALGRDVGHDDFGWYLTAYRAAASIFGTNKYL